MPPINYIAVLITAVVIFILGGLWYSPLMFANKWAELQPKAAGGGDDDAAVNRAGAAMYAQVFVCGLVTSLCMATLLKRFDSHFVLSGIKIGLVCWLGFAGATSYGTALFSSKSRTLWLIDSGFNLMAIFVAAIFLAIWG
jgi:hypothetical protein